MAPKTNTNHLRNFGEGGLNSSKSLEPTSQAHKILTSNRGGYIKALRELKPIKVMSYTYPSKLIEMYPEAEIKLILNSQFAKGKTFPKTWKVRSNSKIHAKIGIGKDNMIIGSWNFTDNSTFNMHEAAIIIDKQHIIKEYTLYFDSIWERSSIIYD